jgi:hypothetical protein
MGENVLKGQVKSFKKGSDRSLKKMTAPTLFDRPDIMSTVYTAVPVEGSEAQVGDRLEAHAAPDGRNVHLVKGHLVIARIEGDGAAALLDGLRTPGNPGVVPVQVQKVSSFSKCIHVVIDNGKGAA